MHDGQTRLQAENIKEAEKEAEAGLIVNPTQTLLNQSMEDVVEEQTVTGKRNKKDSTRQKITSVTNQKTLLPFYTLDMEVEKVIDATVVPEQK